MSLPLVLTSIAQFSTLSLVNSLIEGIALTLFAFAVLRVVGKPNAGTRFAVWFSTLLALAILPWFRAMSEGQAGVRVLSHPPPFSFAGNWAWIILCVWLLFACIGLTKIAVGLAQLLALRRGCKAVSPSSLSPVLQDGLKRSSRKVEILITSNLRVPTAVGFFRPAVVLPVWAMNELAAADLNHVVFHELAHLERRDDWTNLAQKILRAIFFFHPAVWWMDNRLSLEREMACDDLVLEQTQDARSYARCLIWLAERVSDKSIACRALALAQGAVSRMRETSVRIVQILNTNRPAGARTWKPAVGLLGIFALLCGVAVQETPDLIAFRDPPQMRAAVSHPVLRARGDSPVSERSAVIPVAMNVESRNDKAVALARPHGRRMSRRIGAGRTESLPAQELAPRTVLAKEDCPIFTQAVFVIVEANGAGAAFTPAVWTITVWHIDIPARTTALSQDETSSKSI